MRPVIDSSTSSCIHDQQGAGNNQQGCAGFLVVLLSLCLKLYKQTSDGIASKSYFISLKTSPLEISGFTFDRFDPINAELLFVEACAQGSAKNRPFHCGYLI